MLRTRTSRSKRKKFLITTGALIVVNAGIAYNFIHEFLPRPSASVVVLGTETVAAAGEFVGDESDGQDDLRPGITLYTVESGDTISQIAEKFNISSSTIRWANELEKTSTIKPGQVLVILPINGIQYTVKSGDTISGIAKKFDADQQEILEFNDLDNPGQIKAGLELIIPDAEPTPAVAVKKPAAPTKSTSTSSAAKSTSVTHSEDDDHDDGSDEIAGSKGFFINPAPGSVLTQGLHAVNAVDFGAKIGSPIIAAAGGTVVVAKGNGAYNGGFGNFIVISHGNGIQTLYAHLSKVDVAVGDSVDQGDHIGSMGSTGKSTGSHLHFEIHGTDEVNPYAKNKKGTKY